MPYSDQFNAGIRKRFGDIQTSLTFSHIRSHNIQMFTRANFYSNGWYTRMIRDGAGNVIGCTDGGEQWIIDFTPDTLPDCPAMDGQLDRLRGQAQPRHEQRQGEIQRHLRHGGKAVHRPVRSGASRPR